MIARVLLVAFMILPYGAFCYWWGWQRGSQGQAEHMLKEYPQLAYWMKLKSALIDGDGGG